MISRLKKRYKEEIIPLMMKKFKYKSIMAVPKVQKIVLNVGMKQAIDNVKFSDSVVEEIAAISGQKPVLTRAKKAISNFKIREGIIIGCKVTLRGERMYEFLDRMVSVSLPRIRDFRGLSDKSFDSHGNYTFGIKEQMIFPEVDYDKVQGTHGMDITIVTSAKSKDESRELLQLIGIPFRKI